MITSLLAATLLQAASAPACAYTAGAAVIPVEGSPFAAEPSTDGCTLYVPLATGRGGAVAVLENRAGAFQIARSMRLPHGVFGSALSPNGALLAVATRDGVDLLSTDSLRKGDDAAAAIVGTAPFGSEAGAIQALFSRDGALIFVSLEGARAVAVIDVAKLRAGAGAHAVIGQVPQAQAPVGMALSRDGERLYAVSQSAGGEIGRASICPDEQGSGEHGAGALSVIDVRTAASTPAKALVALASAGCNPVRVAVAPDGGMIWVTARGEDRLLGFRSADLIGVGKARPVVQLKTGRSPVGLAITPDGARAWVSASARFGGRAQVESVDLQAPSHPTAAFPAAGGFPRDVRVLADGRSAAVALYAGRRVQIVVAP